ncbi:hypothetical protein Lal_00042152 [Lupinus albus]|nr:hypothetical protein Lal_00042152 [Lupinus albus]
MTYALPWHYSTAELKGPSSIKFLNKELDNMSLNGGRASLPPSSSGSGNLSFKEAAGIRLPLGVGYYEWKLIMDYQKGLKLIFPGSMPERLMGTDCKFVGNMSTLVQIQLGPIVCRSTMK